MSATSNDQLLGNRVAMDEGCSINPVKPVDMVSSVTVNAKYGKVKRLTCCCCGETTTGRQWFNRDTGYGLCKKCINFCARGETNEAFRECYGIRGIHFDLPEQHEIDAQIETAMHTRAKYGHAKPSVLVCKLVTNFGCSLGFIFKDGNKVGDILTNEDGSFHEVLAVLS